MMYSAAPNVSSLESTKRKLERSATSGDWKSVLEIYKCDPRIHSFKITISGDTALHLAIADGQESIVKELVKIVSAEALRTENERGNTPLHLAAALGSIRMCSFIILQDHYLTFCRNHDGETPLFLAALHGMKDAFLLLDDINGSRDTRDRYSLCRKNNGDNILHCAIAGEYFDLAFQIIRRYKNLVHYRNERGFTPLHVLAEKPAAFRSGSHLERFPTMIYRCIRANKWELQTVEARLWYRHEPNYLENSSIGQLLKKAFRFGSNSVSAYRGNDLPDPDVEDSRQRRMVRYSLFGANDAACFEAFRFMFKAMIDILFYVSGSKAIAKIRELKKKHTWSAEVLDEFVRIASPFDYGDDGYKPRRDIDALDATIPSYFRGQEEEEGTEEGNSQKKMQMTAFMKRETPILIAARNGITEMVSKILVAFPAAAQDKNSDQKNILLLAVENRQPEIYEYLRKMKLDSLFRQVDKDGNSALHLAARLEKHGTWLIPAVQIQWENKWYEFVKNTMPKGFWVPFNNQGKTPEDVFTETHQDLVTRGGEWLISTSESCSFVGALVATVAFATATTFPGGVMQDKGTPTLKEEPAFHLFAISSLLALSFSVTSVVLFLTILASRYQGKDFRTNLPKKLLLGLTSLFIAITAMLISFCAGHFFLLKGKWKHPALLLLVYALACLPATFAIARFPLYLDIMLATLKNIPHRSFQAMPPKTNG